MQDNQIIIGTKVEIQEPGRQPLNGAIATVVEIGEHDNAPIYTVEVYGATYGGFRAYDFVEAE